MPAGWALIVAGSVYVGRYPPGVGVGNGNWSQWTKKKEQALLDQLRNGKTVAGACRACGVQTSTFYYEKNKRPEFATAVAEAIDEGTDLIEDELLDLGREGNVVALLATLKARRPKKWREQQAVEHTGPEGAPLTIVIAERQDGPQ